MGTSYGRWFLHPLPRLINYNKKTSASWHLSEQEKLGAWGFPEPKVSYQDALHEQYGEKLTVWQNENRFRWQTCLCWGELWLYMSIQYDKHQNPVCIHTSPCSTSELPSCFMTTTNKHSSVLTRPLHPGVTSTYSAGEKCPMCQKQTCPFGVLRWHSFFDSFFNNKLISTHV